MQASVWIIAAAASLMAGPVTASATADTLDEAAYNQALRRLHLDLTRDELIALAEREYDRIERAMRALAHQVDASTTWQQIVDDLERRHRPASLAEVIPAYRKETERARAFVVAKDLVTLPDAAPLAIEPTPPELLETFPYVIYQWRDALLVTLAFRDDAAGVEEALRTHNNGLIAVAAVHEVYPGHRVQNLTRPGMQIAEAFTEGWGLYVEELMFRLGYYDDRPPAIKLFALRMLLHRAARALLDPKIHRGDLSPEAAIRFLVERVGISRHRAAMEVTGRYLTQPGSAATYLVGKRQIEQLRRQIEAREGAQFTLKRFHDRLLSRGGVPVQDIARFAFITELDREGVVRAEGELLIAGHSRDVPRRRSWIGVGACAVAALALLSRRRRTHSGGRA